MSDVVSNPALSEGQFLDDYCTGVLLCLRGFELRATFSRSLGCGKKESKGFSLIFIKRHIVSVGSDHYAYEENSREAWGRITSSS